MVNFAPYNFLRRAALQTKYEIFQFRIESRWESDDG